MNWDNQLSSIISAADGSLAKIRERFALQRVLSRDQTDVYPVRDMNRSAALPSPTSSLLHTTPALGPAVQWTDLTALQAQLNSQSQAIESLNQKLRSVERERNAQQRHIQTLQEEVRSLEGRLEDQEKGRDRDLMRKEERDPAAERRLEQWKKEVERELNSIKGHFSRAMSLSNQEESFSSKSRWEEVEKLSRDVDLLKGKLRRQEDDVYQQWTEVRETRRQCEHKCKTLENVTDSYHTQRLELTKVTNQYQQIEQDVKELRLNVSELNGKMRRINTRGRYVTAETQKSAPPEVAVAVATHPRRRLLSRSDLEDDLSPTPSLGDVSSDDLDTSWLGEPVVNLRSRRRDVHLSLSASDLSDAASELESNHSDLDGKHVYSSSPELSVSDL